MRHTVLRVIGDHYRRPRGTRRSWQGRDLDLTGVTIDGPLNFNGATFSGGRVSFEGATFSGVLLGPREKLARPGDVAGGAGQRRLSLLISPSVCSTGPVRTSSRP
ncbi:pentapeptide repeat-containing protein [Streptomyces sp. NPDC058145]|uniref:pentapeptide repeat-containing protein n=1 Tax=Streptomyces sp. NPDC058145 TaxID=3346356 RepID=UPI0036EDB874